jgi:hypothetical protein
LSKNQQNFEKAKQLTFTPGLKQVAKQLVMIQKLMIIQCPRALIHKANVNPNPGKTERSVASPNSH